MMSVAPRQAATDVDRTAGIVAKMSLADKIALACADFAAVAHLGLPPLSFTDGGNGVRVADDATAFPACVSLAAAFDEQLAYRFGSAVGQEARSAGHNVLLGPALDIARTPLGGRLPEAFGEDPYLTGALGAAYVRGVQRNVVAMVKHFVVNNFETGRTGSGWPPSDRGPAVDIRVSRRALEEIYFPPFRRALTGAGAGSVMGSYNQVNGCYACQNPELLGTLKDQWGWAGFVAPDFMFAVRDPLAAARAGLDLPGLDDAEGRRPEDFTSGRIGPDRLDDMVTRMVSTMVTHGLLDRPAAVPRPPSRREPGAGRGSRGRGERPARQPGRDAAPRGRRKLAGRHRPGGTGRHLRDGRIADRETPPAPGGYPPGRDPAAGRKPRPGRACSRVLG